MNTLDALFSWFTVATVRGSLLALAVLALQVALRGRLPARWRYALWLPVVFVLATPILPQSRWSLQNSFVHRAGRIESRTSVESVRVAPIPGLESLPQTAFSTETAPEFSWRRALQIIWLTGVAGVLIIAMIGYARALRRIRSGRVPTPPEVTATVNDLAADQAPRLLVSTAIGSPAVTGFFKPTLLLPADFLSLFTPAEARLVLLHELTHLARYDLLSNWLLCLVQALHWCNPLLWFAFARMRADREAACDAQVLDSAAADLRADYGHALLKLEGDRAHPSLSLGFIGLFERATSVRSRVRAIAAHRSPHPAWSALGAALVATLALVGATRAQDQSLSSASAGADALRRTSLTKKMNELIIPRLEFHEATGAEALDFLHKKSVELDTSEPDLAKRGVRFVLNSEPPANTEARITVSLTNIPLIEATRYVTSLAEWKFKIGTEAVAVMAKDVPEELILREWKVTPELLAGLGFKTGGDVKEILQTAGVAFPNGAAAALVDDERRLVVRTSEEYLDLVDTLLVEAGMPAKFPDAPSTDGTQDPREKTNGKLISIVIPRLEFRGATLREAVEFLKRKSVELDITEPDPSRRGVNIALKLDEAATPAGEAPQGEPRLTISLTNIPLGEALKYVTNLANTKFRVEPFAVAIVPMDWGTKTLVTKEFRLDRAMEEKLGFGRSNESEAAISVLNRAGVEFPAGAAAIYLPARARLIVRNTPENLDRIDALLARPATEAPRR